MRPQPQPRYLLRWRRMSVERSGGDCLKNTLIIYTLFFWVSGFALIFLGLWMVLDPKRNYILELVNFSEDDPLLTFAAYVAIVAGCCTLLVGFLGCCGAVKRMRFILACFIISLALICIADIAIATLALVYRNKVADAQTTLRRMVKFEYGVSHEIESNRLATTIIDKLQFHEKCCGALSPSDYIGSRWEASVLANTMYDEPQDRPLVPVSCCTQIAGASALNPLAKSLARCQQLGATKQWRHAVGCHEKLQSWFNEQVWIFVGVGFGFALFMMLGMILATLLCSKVRYYYHVKEDDY